MKGKSRKRIIIGVCVSFFVAGLIWVCGWAIWDEFKLWETMQNLQYRNGLFVVMGFAIVVGIAVTLKKRKVLDMGPEIEHRLEVQHPAQNPVDLGPLTKKVDEISKKVADIHMAMTFLKNVKEKTKGEKA